MHISTQGLVLREVNYKESDKLLTVLTAEGGKRTVKARGCRRKGSPLAAAAQLLVYSDMTLFEYRDYFTLNEAESLQQFWRVRSDLERLSLASYFAEVMEAVAVEGRPDPPALSLILNSLYALDRLNRPLELVKAAFELKLMCLEGLRAPAGRLRGVRRAGAGVASVPPERGGALLRRLPGGGGGGGRHPPGGGSPGGHAPHRLRRSQAPVLLPAGGGGPVLPVPRLPAISDHAA